MLMVAIMGFVFIAAAIALSPDLLLILKGLFIPNLPGKSVLMVIGLIGTTVVPYNLFLHASSVKNKWRNTEELKMARLDSFISIILGGLITMCILIAATVVKSGSGLNTNLSILSQSLNPILGSNSTLFVGLGFLAAGLSSSITAPLAAAYATSEILGWESSLKSISFRLVWMIIIAIGILFSSIGFKPTEVIVFAQIANGLLLPIIAVFLVWIMNDKNLFGAYINSRRTNVLGILVILVTVILGIKGIISVF
jgi:Mn2+/Fe2+ NRAMP family transporter